MTKTHSPHFLALMGSGSNKAFKLLLFVMLLGFGQIASATGWGGIQATAPNGAQSASGIKNNGNTFTGYAVDSNAGNIGTARTFADYTTGACGVDAYVNTSGGCTGSASNGGGCGDANAYATITITSNATTACVITYSGDADSSNSGSTTQRLTIKQYVGWVLATVPPFKVVTDADYTVTAQGQNIQGGGPSGIAPSYTSSTPSVCTVNASSGLVHNVTFGTCTIVATITAGNTDWAAPATTTASTSWYVKKAQTITVTTAAPSTKPYLGTFPVAASSTAGTSYPVTIATSGGCSGGGTNSATITMTSGTTACTVTYTQAGDGSYGAAPTVTSTTTATKLTPTMTTPVDSTQGVGSSFGLSASSTNGALPVVITVTAGLCSIVSGGNNSIVLISLDAGSCTVNYSQAGDANYNAPSPASVSRTITIAKLPQTISFPAQAAQTFVSGGTFPISPLASSTSGFAVAYASTTPSVCTITGLKNNVVQMVAVGSCIISANQAGNASYNAASAITTTIVINKAPQIITVTQAAPSSVEAGSSFPIAATASSGLAVTITPSNCSYSAGTVSGLSLVGSNCTITYSQAGNGNYNAANVVVSSTLITRLFQTITITQNPSSSVALNSNFDVTASASSGLAVAITVSGGCSINSGGSNTANLKLTSGTNPCTIKYNQAGSTSYSPATEMTSTVTAIRVAQVITITTAAPASAVKNATFNVTANSKTVSGGVATGLAVAITVSGGCSGSGNNSATITMTSDAVSCEVNFNQAGDNTYSPAAPISSIVRDGTAPTITQVVAVPSVTNQTPEYTFSSSESGTIVYGGACSSTTTFANVGNNTVMFNQLAVGTYSNCTVKVVDAMNNTSNILALGSFTTKPNVIAYVKTIAVGTGDCSSWANACSSLQAAINVPAVTQVWIAQGIYRPTSTVILKAGVAIYGGFAGTETSYMPSRVSVNVDNDRGVFSASVDYDKSDQLKYVTIISGDKDNNDVTDSRGLVLYAADIQGTNLSTLFSATNLGVIDAKRIKMSRLILNAAKGSANGAALSISDSYILADRVQFVLNQGANGGAVYVTAANAGTAGSKFEVIDSVFLKNSATASGGAISSATNNANMLGIQGSTFEANSAVNGGALNHTIGRLWALNSTFVANTLLLPGTGSGGAINLGALTYPSSADIRYVTLVKNIAGPDIATANGRGGAININTGATAVAVVANSLVVDNTATIGANIADMARMSDGGYNVVGFNGISGLVTGAGNSAYDFVGTTSVTAPTLNVEDILDTNLADNGGYTPTLKLKKDSFARDKISNIHADCEKSTAVGVDQRGFIRPDVNGHFCDVGAVEWDNIDLCSDPNRRRGFFVMHYPGTTCLASGGLAVSVGAVNPLLLIMMSLIGLGIRLRKKQQITI